MGGEKPRFSHWAATSLGSPPHGRGKGGAGVLILGQIGITPALAGKSREIPLHLRAAKDHPRVGGEKVGPVC